MFRFRVAAIVLLGVLAGGPLAVTVCELLCAPVAAAGPVDHCSGGTGGHDTSAGAPVEHTSTLQWTPFDGACVHDDIADSREVRWTWLPLVATLLDVTREHTLLEAPPDEPSDLPDPVPSHDRGARLVVMRC